MSLSSSPLPRSAPVAPGALSTRKTNRPPSIDTTFKLGSLFHLSGFEGTTEQLDHIMAFGSSSSLSSPLPTTDTSTCPNAPARVMRGKPKSSRQLFPPKQQIKRTREGEEDDSPLSPPVLHLDELKDKFIPLEAEQREAIIRCFKQATADGGVEDWGGDLVHVVVGLYHSDPHLARDVHAACCPEMDLDRVLQDSHRKRCKVIAEDKVVATYWSSLFE